MVVDKELLRALDLMKQGKEEGFNILYAHTHNYVYSRARIIMKNEEDALDLTQEVFVQAYKGIGKLENANNIYAWLGAITYNQGMKIFNKKKDILIDEDSEYVFEDIVSTDKDTSPEATTEEKVVAEVVMEMIDELPELQKTALVAFYYDNMKIDDIAEMCECSANTIKSRLNYAKKFLKEKVEAHEKANGYKLHSVTPIVILWAIKAFLSSDAYTMSGAATKAVYGGACANIGVTSSAVAATATTANAGAQVIGVTSKSIGVIGKIAGLSTATKIVAGVVAAVVVAGSVATGVAINSNQKQPDRNDKEVVAEGENTQVVEDAEEEEQVIGEATKESAVINQDIINGGKATYSVEIVTVEKYGCTWMYPKISGWSNKQKQEEWNAIFEPKWEESQIEKTGEQTFSFRAMNDNILSISFSSNIEYKDDEEESEMDIVCAAYNINMKTGEQYQMSKSLDLERCKEILDVYDWDIEEQWNNICQYDETMNDNPFGLAPWCIESTDEGLCPVIFFSETMEDGNLFSYGIIIN